MALSLRRESSRHLLRTLFWAAQVPPAVWVGGWKPDWEHWLMTYLVAISLAALIESAMTDYFTARRAERDTA